MLLPCEMTPVVIKVHNLSRVRELEGNVSTDLVTVGFKVASVILLQHLRVGEIGAMRHLLNTLEIKVTEVEDREIKI